MRNLVHHAADGRRVFTLDHLVQSRETKSLHHRLVLLGRADDGTYIFDLDGLLLCSHHSTLNSVVPWIETRNFSYSSWTDLPRKAATLSRSRNCESASKVALITLCGFAVPKLLVSTFWMPAEVITARTAPPAITPVPSGAGFSSTCPAP